jgi:hypothetical protein
MGSVKIKKGYSVFDWVCRLLIYMNTKQECVMLSNGLLIYYSVSLACHGSIEKDRTLFMVVLGS